MALIRANQITGTTSDFKMGVIKGLNKLLLSAPLKMFGEQFGKYAY